MALLHNERLRIFRQINVHRLSSLDGSVCFAFLSSHLSIVITVLDPGAEENCRNRTRAEVRSMDPFSGNSRATTTANLKTLPPARCPRRTGLATRNAPGLSLYFQLCSQMCSAWLPKSTYDARFSQCGADVSPLIGTYAPPRGPSTNQILLT